MPTVKRCERCGKTFMGRYVAPKSKNPERFCSRACGYAARVDRRARIVCASCRVEFTRTQSEAAKCDSRFCSRDCWRAGIKVAATPCAHCGRPFVPKSAINKTCSRRCRVEHSRRPLLERLWEKIDKNGPVPTHRPELGPCWPWTVSVNSGGYGMLLERGRGSKRLTAHRLTYELAKGPIPSDLEIDHLCRNRRCCNPDHLEPVTSLENQRRGLNVALRETCKKGHPTTDDNWIDVGERRYCKACYWASRDAKMRGRKRSCIRGHEFDSANTRIDNRGWRQCKACDALRAAGDI